MREYEDDIRLYTPVLQRIIILVAVIVAVPVVLWTITAFVRSYVAPPRLPTFQPMALVPQSDSAPANPQASAALNPTPNPAPSPTPAQAQVTVPPAQIGATGPVSDGRSALLDIRKPPGGPPPQSAAAAVGAGSAPQIVAATPAQPTIAQPAVVVTPPGPAQPMAAPAPAAQAAPATPFGTSQNAAAKGDSSAAPSGADHSIAWPNPNGTATGPVVAAPDQQNSNDASADALPVTKPIAGRIPLPRRRPNVVAMVQPNPTPTGIGQSSAAPPGSAPSNLTRTSMAQNSVPLPRARPADAPEPAAPDPPDNASFYERGWAH
jgi:hypothetical protein